MKTPKRVYALLGLALFGLALSIYQVHHFFDVRSGTAGFKTFCDISKNLNCTNVDLSSFAEFVPGFPLSAFAAGWFLALALIWIWAQNAFALRECLRVGVLMTGFGVVMSVIYFYIMAAVLKTFCFLCLFVDLTNVISFALVLSLKPEGFKIHPWDKKKWKGFAVIAGLSLAATLVYAQVVRPPGISQGELDELVDTTLKQTPVSIEVESMDAVHGPSSAPVTIIKFSDFQCGACRRGAESLHTILQEFHGKVRFVLKNFPLDSSCNRMIKAAMHPASCEAARVAYCASKQGKFLEAYETLFENQLALSPGKVIAMLEQTAPSLLSYDALRACAPTDEAELAVRKTIEDGIKAGVESTPTFYVNGYQVAGAYPPQFWRTLLKRLLK